MDSIWGKFIQSESLLLPFGRPDTGKHHQHAANQDGDRSSGGSKIHPINIFHGKIDTKITIKSLM